MNASHRMPCRGASALPLLATLLLAVLLPGGAALAQDETLFDAVLLDRLGLLELPRTGARSLALGGSGVAWTEDLQSLTLNPAGLTGIGRIETQLGFRRLQSSQLVTYFGNSREQAPASTSLDAMGVAYPFPTYRGSLVAAVGVFRRFDPTMEMLWEGVNAYDGDSETYSLQLEGGLMGIVGGFGVALAPTTDVGLSIEYLHGGLDLFSRFDYQHADSVTLYRDLSEDHYDLRGWRAHLGLQARPREELRIGIRISSPAMLNIDGESRWRELDILGEVGEQVGSGFYVFAEKLRLPYQVAAGAALHLGPVALSAELEYVDWNQTRLSGRRLSDLELRAALAETVNQHYGIELGPSGWPVRIYAGYSRLQEPLRFLESGEFVGGLAILKELDVALARSALSGGFGLFLSENILLEAGYSREHGVRRTRPETSGAVDLRQETTRSRALVTFSYRF